jgi:hypothetical protein
MLPVFRGEVEERQQRVGILLQSRDRLREWKRRTPGEGGLAPGMGVQLPSSGKFVGYSGLSCVAPPPVSFASVALPDCTCFTSAVFVGGIYQTLASYVSMHTFPTFTESGGHLSVAARAAAAAASQTAAILMM